MFKIAKQIRISAKLEKSGFQKELNQLLKKGYDLNINSGNFKSVVNEITNNTKKLKNELTGIGQGSFDNVTKSAKESMKVFTEYADAIGRVNEISQRRTENRNMKDELVQAKAINQALDEQYKKQLSLNNLKGQLQVKLSTASNNGLVDTSVIDNLQSKLNSLNSNSAEKEINELKTAINNLSSNDSGIVRVQQAIIKLQERISSIKSSKIDLINSSDLSELTMAEVQLEKLRTTLSSLKSGEVINGKAISNQINIANNSVRILSNSFSDLNTSGGRLSSTMRDIFTYAIGGTGVYTIINSLKNASDVVIELNKNMVDLKKVTDETQETYNNFLKNMHSVALELGTQSSAMVNATTNWAKTGKNLQEASKLAENTVLLTKVGDVENVDTAQTYMLPALQAFNIEAEKSIALIDKYNNISNNMATTVNDVGDAMSKSASSMSVAGNSLEQTIALIATAESQTKLGGAEVGTALKTLSMRLATFKDTETGEVIPQMAEKIKELSGVDITDLNGQLRNTYDIYTEIGKVYKDLDQNTQMQLNEILGGKLRGNIVSAILSNVSELQRAYDLANNSAGSAMNEFEKYQEGIEYSIDRLKEQVNGLYTSFINSDFLKGLTDNTADAIGMFNKLVSTIGSFPTTVTLATGAITIFNKSFRENIQIMTSAIPGIGKLQDKYATYVSGLDKQITKLKEDIATKKMSIATNIQAGNSTQALSKEVVGLQQQLVVSTAKTIALKTAMIALQAITTSLISFGISALISGFSKLIDSAITTKDELNEMKESFSLAFSETSELDTLVQKQRELKDQLEDTTLSTDEQKTKKEELIGVQRQLAELLPETATGFDSEGNKISEDTGLIQENIEKKKELLAMESVNIAKETNNGEWNKLLNNYKKQEEEVKRLQKLYNDTPTPINLENLTKAEEKLDSYKEKLKQLSEMMSAWKDAEFSDKDMSELLFGDIYDNSRKEQEIQAEKFAKLKSLIDEYTASIQENTKAKEENNNNVDTDSDTSEAQSSVNALKLIYEELGYTVKEATDRIEELNEMSAEDKNSEVIKDATKAYGEAISEAQKLRELMDEINENGLEAYTVIQLASEYPELGSRILDVAQTQEFLNQKYQEQADIYGTAMEIMVADNENWYANNIANNQSVQNKINELCNKIIKDQGEAYNIDVKNYKTLTQLKNAMNGELVDGLASWLKTLVGGSADTYAKDLRNCKSWAEQKAYLISQLDKQIEKANKNLQAHLTNIINGDSATNGNILEDEKLYQRVLAQINELNKAKEEIQTQFDIAGDVFDRSIGDISKPSGGSSNKPSSSTNKEVDDISLKVDWYYRLNDAISDYNNLIEENQEKQKHATGKERIDLIKEEIELSEKLAEAKKNLADEYQKEVNQLQKDLKWWGFEFDANNNLINSAQKLLELKKQANSLSGDEKKNMIDRIEDLESMISRFESLTNSEIPELLNGIADINNSIKDLYQDQLDLVADTEKEIYEVIEYYANKTKEAKVSAIEEQIDKLNELYDLEDREDKLSEKKSNLANIKNQMDLYENAQDSAGRAKYEELKSKYDKLLKELNTTIRDNQKDSILDSLEAQKEDIEKQYEDALSPENVNKIISDAMKNGYIQLGDEVLDLNSATTQYLAETTTGTQNLINANTELLNSYLSIKDILKDISKLNSNLGNIGIDLNTVYSGMSRSNTGNTVSFGDITVQITGGTNMNERELNNTIQQALVEFSNKLK